MKTVLFKLSTLTAIVLSLSLTSCATLNDMQKQNEIKNLQRTSPTHAERADVLNRMKSEIITQKITDKRNNQSTYEWLPIGTFNNKSFFVDTFLNTSNLNTASSRVKILNKDKSFSILYYKFFCNEGYGRILFGDKYNAQGNKKFQIPFLGSDEAYDRVIVAPEERKMAKTICAMGGFSHDPTTFETRK